MIYITVKPTARAKQWLEPDGLILIRGWARNGLTVPEIAKKMGVSRTTLFNWQKKYSVLLDSLKKGKEVSDNEVEEALFKRAIGFTYVETKVVIDETDGIIRKRTEEYTRYLPPDPTAIAIWLNNRKPNEWRRNANKEKLDEKRFDHDREIDNKKHW